QRFLTYLGLVGDRDASAVGVGQLAGRCGECAGGADGARLHFEIARVEIARGNGVSDPAARLRALLVPAVEEQLDRLELGLGILRLLLELRELPTALRCAFDAHLRQFGGAEPAARLLADGEREGLRAEG